MEVLEERPKSKQKKKREKKSHFPVEREENRGEGTESKPCISSSHDRDSDALKTDSEQHLETDNERNEATEILVGESEIRVKEVSRQRNDSVLTDIAEIKPEAITQHRNDSILIETEASQKKPEEKSQQQNNDALLKVDENVVLTKSKFEENTIISTDNTSTKEENKDSKIIAPVINEKEQPNSLNSFDKILLKNKQIMQTTVDVEQFNHYVEVCSNKASKKPQVIHCTNEIVTIKPYTEAQLLALYSNSELNVLEQITTSFVECELKGLHMVQHPLYNLLEMYLLNRNKVTANNLELEQSRKEYVDLQNQLWNVQSAVVKDLGQCQDGNTVVATHTYNKASFHRTSCHNMSRVLAKIRHLSNECHVLYTYSAEVSKLQIELYIQVLIANCVNSAQMSRDATVCLASQAAPAHVVPTLNELRICISILFLFQRRLICDAQFLKETREWLSGLVAVLLRLANYQDHLFLLNQILRCPPGVGTWASSFIQTPLATIDQESPFANSEINHVIAVLALILMPINKRDQFLEELMHTKDAPGDSLWVVVDSDGEEDEESSGILLRENDLVSFLNQLPMDDLFKSFLLVKKRGGQDYFDARQISEHHLLRFFAFMTVLLKILQGGLNTYIQTRYNQFSKRLCRLIRHIVQYATDLWEYFKTNVKLEDVAMSKRLQVEYDAFFLRATYYLYSSQKMGAWQFLAVVPYNLVSSQCLWKIYYFLHDDTHAQTILNPIDSTDFKEKLWDSFVRSQYEDKLSVLEDAESYYLLNTFANMALSRTFHDIDFIEAATVDLLQVGYISEVTQEICSKNARILLTHITSKYPNLLSNILKIVEDNIDKIGSLCLHLYEELPLSIWCPTDKDIDVITRLLKLSGIASNRSRLARMIISRLNWELTENSLFIPYRMHKKIALLVAEVVDEEPGYMQWGWQTIFRLKLHISDKGFMDFTKISELEQYDILRRGIREQKLIACFLSVLITSWGHLIPLICLHGLDQLIILQMNQKNEAVLFALNLIVPLFLNCQESLINCDKFQTVLVGLLNADKGYLHLAKSLISVHSPVLEQFGHMLENQIVNCNLYNDINSPRCIVRLWMNSLVSVPNWSKDYSVMYLLDIVIRASFFYVDTIEVVTSILRELLQCATPQEQTNTIISLFKWVSSSNGTQGNLLINTSLSSCPWLAYIMIDVEYEERERQTGLWKEILCQMIRQKGKINVDAAIKKAAGILKVPSFTSGSLCFYRWAQQALDTPIDHPLLPLLWQKFFSLYLYRIPPANNTERCCIGEKFFDGMINFAFQKRLKKRLEESVEYYQQQLDNAVKHDASKKYFYELCLKLFRAYGLWLEEPRLQENSLFLPSLPQQYEPQQLALIIQGSTTPWLEYLNYDAVKESQQNSLKSWRCANFREKSKVNQPHPNPGSRVESDDPIERILRRLQLYDTPKEAPQLKVPVPVIQNFQFKDKDSMFKALQPYVSTIKQFSHEYGLSSSEHKALDCSYQDLLPQLYKSVICKIKKQVTCNGLSRTSHCAGAAVITLQFEEVRINQNIQHLIDVNRENSNSLLKKFLQPPAQSLCLASVSLLQAINILQIELKQEPATSEMGVELFYYIVSLLNEETVNYFPSKKLLSDCLEKLGQSHICGVEFETPRLLNKILDQPNLGDFLAPHFSPINTGTANFLLMYSTISKEVGHKVDTVFALLSKFDVTHWLMTKDPKLVQRSKFIEYVIKALQSLGHEPQSNSLVLHELFRKHLVCILNHQFPEHFGEILMVMLKASNSGTDAGCIAISVWLDFLNFLAKPTDLNLNMPLRDQIRYYAQHQRLLNHTELLETATLLGKYFTQERYQYGLYGLYPKTRNYVDVFMAFIGMVGHGLIISTLNVHGVLPGDKLCEMIWPFLRDMFAPWILPYWMQNMKDNMANWIKQLADDRAILLPWIPSDSPSAVKAVHMFFECIMFIIQTLPACGNILSFIWHWYVTNFAHPAVKDHILNVIYGQFVALPWQNFWPTLTDLDLMLKVIEQYLPECHAFLGHIFMSVSWPQWLTSLSDKTPVAIKVRVYHTLLNLLIKLSNEPNVRNNHNERAKALLVQAEVFEWNLIEPAFYQQIMDWYVMSYDSLVLFKSDPLDLDFRVLLFLRLIAYYNKSDSVPKDSLQKHHIYIRSYVKLIAVFVSKHRALIPSKANDLNTVITNQLKDLERYHNQEGLNLLLEAFMEVLNLPSISNIALNAFEQWIANKSRDGVFLNAVLHSLGIGVCDMGIAANLYETALNSYFVNNVCQSGDYSWNNVVSVVIFNSSKHTELEQVLVSKGYLMTLHAYVMKKIERALDYKNLFSVCLEWLSNLKISEAIEPKVPLIWFDLLTMAIDYCEMDEGCTRVLLYKFVQILVQSSDEKEGSKWSRSILGAIGIAKQPVLSIQYKFLCRALAGYILAQLPDAKGNSQAVRRTACAPCTVGQPGGNSECPKILLKLDFGYTQGKIKECAEMALKQIQNPANSLQNVNSFLSMLLNQFYIKPYLKDIG